MHMLNMKKCSPKQNPFSKKDFYFFFLQEKNHTIKRERMIVDSVIIFDQSIKRLWSFP